MENNTKNIIAFFVGFAIIFSLGFIASKPIRADKTRKQDILNFINGKSTKNIDRDTVKVYKEITKDENVEYDISDMVSDYILKIEKTVKAVYLSNTQVKFSVDNNIVDSSSISLSKSYLSTNCTPYIEQITNEDKKDYKDGVFSKKLVEKLEKILKHKSTNMMHGWFINDTVLSNAQKVSNNKFLIELPFKVYITFTKKIVNKNTVKMTKCSLSKPFPEKEEYKVILTDENNKEYTTYLTFNRKDWFHKRDMTINIFGITSIYEPAKVTMYIEEDEQKETFDSEKPEKTTIDGMVFERNNSY